MIEVKNLNKTYDRNRRGAAKVLHDISFTLPDTGFVCILGPSGCGKTSLLNAVGGLDTFDSGTVTGQPEDSHSFGYIFQNYYLLMEHSVGYNVYLGLHDLDLSHREKLARVKEALGVVDMERYIRRCVAELSGGQQQRVAIARALARRPRVIFADEPTGNLDEANTMNICTLLRQISRTSLVVMVTHEERIARFFADRIITLDNGRIASDSSRWERGSLSQGGANTLYTGDYTEVPLSADQVSLRIFREAGAAGVDLSIFALKDRIIIKFSDPRTVTCGTEQEPPAVAEGPRPSVTLAEVDSAVPETALLWEPADNIRTKPGQAIHLGDMAAEAAAMGREKGLRGLGTRLFLLILTVLTAISAADVITLSSIDPRDFIQTHSQVLSVSLERSQDTSYLATLQDLALTFRENLDGCGQEYTCVPGVPYTASVSGSPVMQINELSVPLSGFSYVPLSYLDTSTLILGRLPEANNEIVVDRWILDKAMAQDGVAQNSIYHIDYFLGKQVTFSTQNYAPVIVGICDGGEAAAYMSEEAFVCLGTTGTDVAALSSLQAAFPGKYDDITLEPGKCIVLYNNAGPTYRDKLGGWFTTKSKLSFQIDAAIDETDFYAKIVVADDQLSEILWTMSSTKFLVFCEDKTAMANYLKSIPSQMGNAVSVTVTDSYGDSMREYQEASLLRADARTIVTATVLVLSLVMLYLLRRSQVQERIGMLAVYRLLGIPGRKLMGIFAMESFLSTLTTALPAALGTWAVIALLRWLPSIQLDLLLPWQAALGVYLAVAVFHLAVTLLPLARLLRLPPARLAAKYDF